MAVFRVEKWRLMEWHERDIWDRWRGWSEATHKYQPPSHRSVPVSWLPSQVLAITSPNWGNSSSKISFSTVSQKKKDRNPGTTSWQSLWGSSFGCSTAYCTWWSMKARLCFSFSVLVLNHWAMDSAFRFFNFQVKYLYFLTFFFF